MESVAAQKSGALLLPSAAHVSATRPWEETSLYARCSRGRVAPDIPLFSFQSCVGSVLWSRFPIVPDEHCPGLEGSD